MANEIITMNTLNINTRNFKDERLAQATERIASIYNDAYIYANQKNREIADILYQVKVEKSYAKDGFKSVADYAHAVFGIAKQNAYQLADAGEVYQSETVNPALKDFTPSKLAEIKNVDREALDVALADGTLTPETTQKQLREFAKSHAQPDESPKVLDRFVARPCQIHFSEQEIADHSHPQTIEEWDTFFELQLMNQTGLNNAEIIKLPNVKPYEGAKHANIQRRLYVNHVGSFVVEFTKDTDMKKNHRPKRERISNEALLDALSNMSAEQIQALLASAQNG